MEKKIWLRLTDARAVALTAKKAAGTQSRKTDLEARFRMFPRLREAATC